MSLAERIVERWLEQFVDLGDVPLDEATVDVVSASQIAADVAREYYEWYALGQADANAGDTNA